MSNGDIELRTRLLALPPEAVFTTMEAYTYVRTSKGNWALMRARGETPRAIRLNHQALGYRKDVLDAWLLSRVNAGRIPGQDGGVKVGHC